MINLVLPDRRFMQACWVVVDIQAAMRQWLATTGVGPFFYFERVPFVNPRYRGEPAETLDLTAAIAQAGDLQIELMVQNDDAPSFVHDVIPPGKSGLHHMSIYSPDYERDFAIYSKSGVKVAYEVEMMGARTCWMDTVQQLGFMVEIIETNSVADTVFAMFRSAAEEWDGEAEPIRTPAER